MISKIICIAGASAARVFVFVSCLVFSLSLAAPSKEPRAKASLITPFDEFGNICWEDEKARLDNFAIQLQQDPALVGYIVVCAGRVSCANEARVRGERKKRWVVGGALSLEG